MEMGRRCYREEGVVQGNMVEAVRSVWPVIIERNDRGCRCLW